MEFFIMGLAIVVIIVALSFFSNLKKVKFSKNQKEKNTSKRKNPSAFLINCPMCNSPLLKGENLVSKVYRPMNVPDQRCTINGCPHCYPKPEPGIKRQCPCCLKEVPITGYLVARLFNYKDNKKHVRITGCSRCCEK